MPRGRAVNAKLLALGRELLTLDEAQTTELLASLDDDQRRAVSRALDLPELKAYSTHRGYVDDPTGWVRDVLGEHLWSKQREVAAALREHRRVAVPSCHGAGKSFDAGRLVAHWIATHPPGDAVALTTAPTGAQVAGILWKEINRAHAKGRLPGRINLTNWYLGGELVAFGRKPADTNPAAFQGTHARFLLVVIDEADGVAANIWEAAETLVTTAEARVLAIGNPDSDSGPFFDACQPKSGWHVIRISAFDTPNFTGEAVPPGVEQLLVSKLWVEERRRKWGEDDPRWRSKVLALPPLDNPNGVVPYSDLLACVREPDLDDADAPVEVGIDVGAGGDMTVAWERRGKKLGRVWRERGNDPMATAGGLLRFIIETEATAAKIDVIGIGYGIAGRLEELFKEGAHRCRIERVNVGVAGRKASGSDPGFPRLRDELWWEVGRKLTIERGWDLSVLGSMGEDGDDVLSQLIAPTWKPDSSNRIHVEAKADVRARLGRSPDDADAILLAYKPSRGPGHVASVVGVGLPSRVPVGARG